MKLIKLSAIPSTNSYMKELRSVAPLEDETVVVTTNQTKGRGQYTTKWQSQPHKSLTFSLYKDIEAFCLTDPYFMSMAVSIGIFNTLKILKINKVAIKWPNDIMAEGKKCCGILIENSIKKIYVKDAIIGIGLNVNEDTFDVLPNATSLFLVSGRKFDLEVVMKLMISEILKQLALLQLNQLEHLHQLYQSYLYRIGEISVFENKEGRKFNGIIRGVTEKGLLILETEDEGLNHYFLKQIKLLV